jgi:hypothetical protein
VLELFAKYKQETSSKIKRLELNITENKTISKSNLTFITLIDDIHTNDERVSERATERAHENKLIPDEPAIDVVMSQRLLKSDKKPLINVKVPLFHFYDQLNKPSIPQNDVSLPDMLLYTDVFSDVSLSGIITK